MTYTDRTISASIHSKIEGVMFHIINKKVSPNITTEASLIADVANQVSRRGIRMNTLEAINLIARGLIIE